MSDEPQVMWWVYLVECGDGSLYCGIARDVEARMRDHATPKGSRYVRSHGGVRQVLWRNEVANRSTAQTLEAWIKTQDRQTKLALAQGGLSFSRNSFMREKSSIKNKKARWLSPT